MRAIDELVRESENHFRVSRSAWTDPEVHQAELDTVFANSWLFLGHESEIPDSGDYVLRRLGMEPVIVVRSEPGEVRVFANTCRHRGIRLCRADRGNASHFRCPYHGWTYANTGDLIGVTAVTEVFTRDFKKADFSLFQPAKVETAFGLIFATWNQDAPPLREYLADMYWYLETVFGKFDGGWEVVGAPVRTLLPTNWKLESENVSGDGYHTPVTHQSAFVMGMFAGPDDWEKMGEVVAQRYKGRVVDCGNGHTFRVHQLPIAAEPPQFFGYPESMWDQIPRNLDPGQVDVQARLSIMHGNVFPNFTVIENFKTSTEANGSHTRYVRLTVQLPTSPGTNEMLWWCMVPKDAPKEWRTQSQRAFLRTNGPPGMLQIDDHENFAGFQESNAGTIVKSQDVVLEGGFANRVDDELGWRGIVYDADKTEQSQRAFWRQWQSQVALGTPVTA